MPLEAVAGDLAELGLEETSVKRLLKVMELRDMEGVEAFLGKESPAAEEVGCCCSMLVFPSLLCLGLGA